LYNLSYVLHKEDGFLYSVDKGITLIVLSIRTLEKYSRGRRGAPAKGVGRETGARVQIPPSPFIVGIIYFCKKNFKKNKKMVDNDFEKLYIG
jgi:hypothetical protein